MIRAATSKLAQSVARQTLRSSIRAASVKIAQRSFTISAARLTTPKEASADSVAALRAEQKLEQETAAEVAEDSADIKEWSVKNGFEIVESVGNDQVQLVKKTPTETIRVFFSISDVVNAEGMLDEGEFEANEGAAEDVEQEDIETPVRVNIVVEKPKGALSIEGVVQDDLVLVESVIPYASAELALQETAEADYSRRQVYQGPPFGVLDPSVQAAVQEFLEAHKLDGDFALFVQEYASFRENKEYIDWLGKIANIVE